MAYYGYYRVSTSTQRDKGYGLETQLDAINKYAEANNIEISEFFHDDGISGTDPTREGLTGLLATLNKGDRVIVLNTSRLWRDDTVKVLVHHTMKKVDADIISIEQADYSIYAKDPTAILFNGMLELLDLYSRLEVNMKLSKGRNTKANRGDKPCGTMPYGYVWRNNTTQIDYNNHLIVQEIFTQYEYYLNHASVRYPLAKVVDYCKDKGYKTHKGNDFSKQTLQSMLNNDFYIGIVTHGDKKVLGNHEPLISHELWSDIHPTYDFSLFVA